MCCHLFCGLRNFDVIDGIRAPCPFGLIREPLLSESKQEQLHLDLECVLFSFDVSHVAMGDAVKFLVGLNLIFEENFDLIVKRRIGVALWGISGYTPAKNDFLFEKESAYACKLYPYAVFQRKICHCDLFDKKRSTRSSLATFSDDDDLFSTESLIVTFFLQLCILRLQSRFISGAIQPCKGSLKDDIYCPIQGFSSGEAPGPESEAWIMGGWLPRTDSDMPLVLIDEVHPLNEPRGAALEAIVTRIKTLAHKSETNLNPISSKQFLAIFATIPNIEDLAKALISVQVWGRNETCEADNKKFLIVGSEEDNLIHYHKKIRLEDFSRVGIGIPEKIFIKTVDESGKRKASTFHPKDFCVVEDDYDQICISNETVTQVTEDVQALENDEEDCKIITEKTVFDHIRRKAKNFPVLASLDIPSSSSSQAMILTRKRTHEKLLESHHATKILKETGT
ncbi:hypothetical protein RJ641_030955 [Dillenia turbinata]|uniref:Uncharacterized protein n=1 Tax=Dillenia turbinata TaxID=194707 RepID=A0AAN8VX82_9MAGN